MTTYPILTSYFGKRSKHSSLKTNYTETTDSNYCHSRKGTTLVIVLRRNKVFDQFTESFPFKHSKPRRVSKRSSFYYENNL